MSKDIYLNYLFKINQYFKDKIESFDDYYPCMQKEGNECNLLDVYNW
jgi:putative transposase